MKIILIALFITMAIDGLFAQVLDMHTECKLKIIENKNDTVIAFGNAEFNFEQSVKNNNGNCSLLYDGFWRIFSLCDTSALVFEARINNGKFVGIVESHVGNWLDKISLYDTCGNLQNATEHRYFYYDSIFYNAFSEQIDFKQYIQDNKNACVFLYGDKTRLDYMLIISQHKLQRVLSFNENGLLQSVANYRIGKKRKTTVFQ